MKVIVTGCRNCPFLRSGESVGCRLSKSIAMDAVPETGVHDDCRLAAGPATVTLAIHTRSEVTGYLEAFVGNRVQIKDGRRGVVVAKYRNADEAEVECDNPEDAGRYWYRIMLDGADYVTAAQGAVTDILGARGGYNHNPDFEFHFGYGDED